MVAFNTGGRKGEKMAAVPPSCFISHIRNVWNEQFGNSVTVFYLVQRSDEKLLGERWEGVGGSNTAPAPRVCLSSLDTERRAAWPRGQKLWEAPWDQV